jgi:GNAT superfamily N-acetyltransferase
MVMSTLKKHDYNIRQFTLEEYLNYKAMRLEALKNEPGMFGNSYVFESEFTDIQWKERVANPSGACFGLYSYKELIGITSIIIDKEKAHEAYMTQSYIQKTYRRIGLSRMLYQARLEWAKKRNLKRLIIAHKRSNVASKNANQHFGFKYTHQEVRNWLDASIEPMIYYELKL